MMNERLGEQRFLESHGALDAWLDVPDVRLWPEHALWRLCAGDPDFEAGVDPDEPTAADVLRVMRKSQERQVQ
jgi:hypothetical protein